VAGTVSADESAEAIMLSQRVVLPTRTNGMNQTSCSARREPASSESIASTGSLGTERHLGLVQQLRHGVDLLLLAFGNVLGKGDRIRILA
jgi:hypothetical protein